MKLFTTFLTLAGLITDQARAFPHGHELQQKSANASFPSTDGLQFNIDGQTGYAAGSNSYWIGFLTNNADVDLVMNHLHESNLKILRVWGFNDVNSKPSDGSVWYQMHADGKSTINTGEDGLQRLDYVVSSAEKHNVKLIINFVNNWDDYGGMAAYVKAYGGDQTGWYTNADIQQAYQTYIKTVVSRYQSSHAVFAWELANEPRCKGCDTSILYDWISKTSKYIKSLDTEHMVCIGDGMYHIMPRRRPETGIHPLTHLQKDLDSRPVRMAATHTPMSKDQTLRRILPFPLSTLEPSIYTHPAVCTAQCF